MLPAWLILVIGMVLGAMAVAALFIPLSLWAGWPRKRERRLERELREAYQGIAEADDHLELALVALDDSKFRVVRGRICAALEG